MSTVITLQTFNTQYNDGQYYNKQQYITNNINNHKKRPYM